MPDLRAQFLDNVTKFPEKTANWVLIDVQDLRLLHQSTNKGHRVITYDRLLHYDPYLYRLSSDPLTCTPIPLMIYDEVPKW